VSVQVLRARLPGAPAVAVLGRADALGGTDVPAAGPWPDARVHLTGSSVLIGPWGSDGTGPCGRCLAIRWQRLRTKSERDALETGRDRTGGGDWPVLPDWCVDAVAAVRAAVAGRPGPGPGAAYVTEVDLAALTVRTVTLLAEPLCPCAEAVPAGVPALRSRPKPAPGTYRLRRAGDYPLSLDGLANPVCGVLGAGTWLDVTSPTTAPVAGTVFMRGYAGLNDVTWSGQANSYAASRDLAFLEGLERYAGTHCRRPGPPLVASYAELGDTALDPRTCGVYSDRTYAEDPAVSPFDPDRPIPWVRGCSLTDGRPVLVPARLVHYSAGVAADNFVFECSNGCATGSCLEEAALFGLLELIERDAFLLGWYGGARLTEIDLDTVPAGAVRTMRQRAELLGYDVHAFDNRADLAAPVVTALAVRRDGGVGTLAFAAASTVDPLAAVEGAICEILTYIPHLPRQVRERPAELAAMAADFSLVRRLPDHAALFGLPEMARHADRYLSPAAVRPFDELYRAVPPTEDLLDDLRAVLDDLTAAGLEAVVVDQTTPEQDRLGLHTVCAIVPGLLPIDFGWSRQRALEMPRLRTAPFRAGWTRGPLTDADRHLVPHPFP
jgi:ribosomal protein S12 methylthiotransferase accessory factor